MLSSDHEEDGYTKKKKKSSHQVADPMITDQLYNGGDGGISGQQSELDLLPEDWNLTELVPDIHDLRYSEPEPSLKKPRKQYVIPLKLKVYYIIVKDDEDEGSKTEYFVKWKNLSYLHCDWISEEILLSEGTAARTKLNRFMKRRLPPFDPDEMTEFPEAFVSVERIIAGRPGPGFRDGDTRFEYLIKWSGQNYQH